MTEPCENCESKGPHGHKGLNYPQWDPSPWMKLDYDAEKYIEKQSQIWFENRGTKPPPYFVELWQRSYVLEVEWGMLLAAAGFSWKVTSNTIMKLADVDRKRTAKLQDLYHNSKIRLVPDTADIIKP